MKFMCIRNTLQPDYAVRDCCRVLVVSTSGYYRWKNATPSARSLRFDWHVRWAHLRKYGWDFRRSTTLTWRRKRMEERSKNRCD